MVDECFGDFLDDPEAHTLKGALEAFPDLLILKAFTKLYGMAGVRLGYALCSDTAFLERMRLAGQPLGGFLPGPGGRAGGTGGNQTMCGQCGR